MEYEDYVTEHLNSFNTLVIQLGSNNIMLAKEETFINLLWSLPDSSDNMVVAIGSTTQSSLSMRMWFHPFYQKR
jgi:hypothetical protein